MFSNIVEHNMYLRYIRIRNIIEVYLWIEADTLTSTLILITI